MPFLSIYLFGTPRVEQEGQPLIVRRRKTIALLAYLGQTGQPHSRDHLATLLWSENDQASARANLRRDISRLKNTLGEGNLLVTRSQVGIDPNGDLWLDVVEFQAYIDQLKEHAHFPQEDCEQCLNACQKAVALYTSDFITGFTLPDSSEFDEWQFFQRESFKQSLADLLQRLIQWHINEGEFEYGVEYGRRWLSLDTLHEPAHRQLMQLYAWSGQQAAALRQYEECVRLLDEELGVPPEPETEALQQAILTRQIEPPQLPAAKQAVVEKQAALLPEHRFQIEKLFAKGGQGEVYLGIDSERGEKVVIKQLKRDLMLQDPTFIARFQREGEVLRRLDHPNIVHILATFERDGQYFIVMEYVPGGSLRHYLRNETQLPIAQVQSIGLELADALARVHHLGIIHRDIKPENVLLAADGSPRLTDFGIAHLIQSDARLTQTGMILGSPAYMSPEALQGEAGDVRSDIWSLGALLYEMLAGEPPFGSGRIATTLVKILHEPLPNLRQLRPEVPLELANLIRQMLTKKVDQRVGSMRQVAATLEMLRNGRIPPREAPLRTQLPVQVAVVKETAVPDPHETPTILHNLPQPPTPFIGRNKELAKIQRLIVEETACRLLTLVGHGGVGKTRLTIEAGKRLVTHFRDGLFFIPLAAVTDAEFIVPAIAKPLGLHFSGAATPKNQLFHFLRNKQMLLIIDNFEQFLHSSDLLSEILRTAPQIMIIVTSRERLRLEEEWGYEIVGLPVPPDETAVAIDNLETFPAAVLFIQRVQRADVSFVLAKQDVPAVGEICRLLEGVPLSLELAATWVREQTMAEIAVAIRRNIDQFSISDGALAEDERTLWAILNQIWHTLPADEQAALSRLSVFRGGCLLEAATSVTGASLTTFGKLVDRGLMRRNRNGRFLIHEQIRQFAAHKLAQDPQEAETTRNKQAHTYLDFLWQRTSAIRGRQQGVVLLETATEIDNIRVAWRYGVAHAQITPLLQAAECYWLFSEFSSILHEAEGAFNHALVTTPNSDNAKDNNDWPILRGFLKSGQGSLMARRGLLEAGIALMEEGMADLQQATARYRQKKAIAGAWLAYGTLMQGRYDDTIKVAQASLATLPENDDYLTKAGALRILGMAVLYKGELDTAVAYLNECLTACNKIGEQRIQTYAWINLGIIATMRGDYGRAWQHLDEAMQLSERLGDRLSRAELLSERGLVAIKQGQFPQATHDLQESQTILKEIGRANSGQTECYLGIIHFRHGERDQAKTLFSQSLATNKSAGYEPGIADSLMQLGLLTYDQGLINQAEQLLLDALAILQNSPNEPKMAEVECNLGHLLAECGQSRIAEVRKYYQHALEKAVQYELAPIALDAFTGLAPLMIFSGETQRAIQLLRLAEQHPAATYVTKETAQKRLVEIINRDDDTQGSRGQLDDWRALSQRIIADLRTVNWGQITSPIKIPWQSSPFIGRTREIADLRRALMQDRSRLLTLVGPGGIGKTRLAMATAVAVNGYSHGIHYIPLAPLETADNLISAIGDAIALRNSPTNDQKQHLLDYLQRKQMLLVLDNFEHLLAGADLVADILAAAPEVQIIVTSRRRLNLGGEVVYPLAGMPYPRKNTSQSDELLKYGAVELFLAQIRSTNPHFELQTQDYDPLVRICLMVQGMPLALVLAAGWSDMLSLTEIAEEIGRSVDFLETDRRDIPQRQRSVRAVFDGSWERISPNEQSVFAQLSVFRSGFTRQAAHAVTSANLRTLRRLVNHSLITVRDSGRYEIHELLRQYGEENLAKTGGIEATRTAHSAYYLQFLQQREVALKGVKQADTLHEIETDIENIRSAWNWAAQHQQRETISQALEALHLFCDLRGKYPEAITLFALIKELLKPDPGISADLFWGRLLIRYAFVRVFKPDAWEEGRQDLEQGMQIIQQINDPLEMGLGYLATGTYLFNSQQELPRALENFVQAGEIFQTIGDNFYLARTQIGQGYCYGVLADLERSVEMTEKGLVTARRQGSMSDVALALSNLAEHMLGIGDYEDAEHKLEEAIVAGEVVSLSMIVAYSQALLGLCHVLKQDLVTAESLIRHSLVTAEEINHTIVLAYAHGMMGIWASLTGDYGVGRTWAQASKDNPSNNSLGLIIAELGLSVAYSGQEAWLLARESLLQLTTNSSELNYLVPCLWSLPLVAICVAVDDRLDEAVELLALATSYPIDVLGWVSDWPLLIALQDRLVSELSADDYMLAWQRGEALANDIDLATAVALVRSVLMKEEPDNI